MNRTPDHTVEISWPPGHKDIIGNEHADGLAKEAAERWSQDYVSLTHAKRTTKNRLEKDWSQYCNWRFGSRQAPTAKPREPFRQAPRALFGRLVQCRTGHGFTGEYYSKFVPSEATSCAACRLGIQTRLHILTGYPLYDAHRHILVNAVPSLYLPDILGTDKGFDATINFLRKSGAFTKTGEPKTPSKRGCFPRPPWLINLWTAFHSTNRQQRLRC